MLEPLTAWDMQAGRVLIGVTVAVLVGCRFLPERWRWPAGAALAGLYGLGFLAFMIRALWR